MLLKEKAYFKKLASWEFIFQELNANLGYNRACNMNQSDKLRNNGMINEGKADVGKSEAGKSRIFYFINFMILFLKHQLMLNLLNVIFW